MLLTRILRSKEWPIFGFVLSSLVCGVLLAGWLVVGHNVHADSERVFELRIYHAVPGKLPLMESRFRDKTSKILARHNLSVIGYWTAADQETFIFLIAHNSREEGKQNWQAVGQDPEFQEIIKAEQVDKTLEKADIFLMRPTDFSSLK